MLVRGMGSANGIQVGEVTAPVAFNKTFGRFTRRRRYFLDFCY